MNTERSIAPAIDSLEDSLERGLTVICDFDGTISTKDIGDDFFDSFGQIQPHNIRFKDGEISIYEYWRTVAGTLPPDITQAEIEQYTEGVEIDPYFHAFLKLLRENGLQPLILSDGFENYIRPVLEREGLGHLELFSNRLELREDGAEGPRPVHPYSKDGCECKSAVCKRAVQCLLVPKGGIAVYIGDGLSDFCPAESSDIVFAKGKLAKWCNENSLPHYPFKSFYQVMRVFRDKLLVGPVKGRNRAKVLRENFVKYE